MKEMPFKYILYPIIAMGGVGMVVWCIKMLITAKTERKPISDSPTMLSDVRAEIRIHQDGCQNLIAERIARLDTKFGKRLQLGDQKFGKMERSINALHEKVSKVIKGNGDVTRLIKLVKDLENILNNRHNL